jgi:hypothetical protein
MTAVSDVPSAAGVATVMADADKFGAKPRAQAANPINKSRFILAFPPWKSPNRDREESLWNSCGSIGACWIDVASPLKAA